jgi:hypothetical protein
MMQIDLCNGQWKKVKAQIFDQHCSQFTQQWGAQQDQLACEFLNSYILVPYSQLKKVSCVSISFTFVQNV